MAVENINPQAVPSPAAQPRGTAFPSYDLASTVEVPRVLHVKGGGQATPDQLAAHLGYKGTNNGAYITRVAAARAFGLINKAGPVFIPTPLAHQILSPVYPHDVKKALVDAFLNVELFRRIYEDFKGKELPPEFGLLNALRNQYGVVPGRIKDAYRILMESADTAGFFSTKAGARTHLIMPLVTPVPGAAMVAPAEVQSDVTPHDFGGGGGGQTPPPPPPPSGTGAVQHFPQGSLSDVKAQYVSTLIKLFHAKSEKGELDEKLMERIERLLDLKGQ
ncbi:hypothetical protein ASE11_19520 [Hydrogenophaga sp. Root209]|uniref:hypothetical protein n=1 Tax=Hydrogenophaga sp. Root209 TaxID=1736490 RepID=UPI0006FBC8DE|nr:hypothetical protein [Hydrogenophaga sp. Root209]KRC11071.1 hypothetical protein ASE11_19520 [Hydrogenophaga sp. Root209]